MLKKILCLTLSLTWASVAAAGVSQSGFKKLPNGHEINIEYTPAQPGKPTLVILNGLTYKLESWNFMMPTLESQGNGILRLDPMGQGQTLLKYAPIDFKISIETQADDLAFLLKLLGIKQPVHLLGLSYGGGWAMVFANRYPAQVASLILMAPFVGPLPGQDMQIRSSIAVVRAQGYLNPLNALTDDELYDYFLKQNVYTTYPLYEPIVLENPFKLEATFRLVQGIRKVEVQKYMKNFPDKAVHLIDAGLDQYIPRSMMDQFWNDLPVSKKASRMNLNFSEHKIPESKPVFAATWVNLILAGDSRISGGKTFEGYPNLGLADSGSEKIDLPIDLWPF